MSEFGSVGGFEDAVNATARAQYRDIQRETGGRPVIIARLALRRDTNYPYTFTERDALVSDSPGEHFGGVIHRDRESGLREIHAAVDEQQTEQSWLYIPEKELWVDHTIRAEGITVVSDPHLPTYLGHMYPDVEEVHTHPDVFQSLAGEDPRFTENWLVESAAPSGDDLVRHVQLSHRSNQDSHLTSTVVSHYGVTTVELNEEGKKGGGFNVVESRHTVDPLNDPQVEVPRVVAAVQSKYVGWESEVPVFDMQFVPIDEI